MAMRPPWTPEEGAQCSSWTMELVGPWIAAVQPLRTLEAGVRRSGSSCCCRCKQRRDYIFLVCLLQISSRGRGARGRKKPHIMISLRQLRCGVLNS
ncbi:hypothetical protein BRADI_4g04865v3 [Brachypodium distachyon]|uniref:Uncharacterized protein n=1 Tax=Brachypodium distachyon TaxID=15368 RepID=A0A2K2CKH5_BRADI|nr:hypothetical protein BRADI_4g04865v3 [Brachypodium distachyon]